MTNVIKTVKVTGLDIIGQATAAKYTNRRNNFNNSLNKFVDDWQKEAADTWAHRDGLSGIKKLFVVSPLTRVSGNISKASIEIKIKDNDLINFPVEQIRVTIGKQLLEVKVGSKHYRQKLLKPNDNRPVVTKVKLLKSGTFNTVVVKGKKLPAILNNARSLGIKGFYYNKKSRVTAKPSTPNGIYARLQSETWLENERLPTYKLFAPPMAYLINSKRVKSKFKWEARIKLLAASLKDNT